MSNQIKNLLKTLDEIRALSFQVDSHESLMANQKKRVESISQDMNELMALKTDYQAKSRRLTHTMDKVQELLQDSAKKL